MENPAPVPIWAIDNFAPYSQLPPGMQIFTCKCVDCRGQKLNMLRNPQSYEGNRQRSSKYKFITPMNGTKCLLTTLEHCFHF